MEAYSIPFEQIHVLSDTRISRLSSEPMSVRMMQVIGLGESDMPNLWAIGGILVAFVATFASIMAGARILKIITQQKQMCKEIDVDTTLSQDLTDIGRVSTSSSCSCLPSSSRDFSIEEINYHCEYDRRNMFLEHDSLSMHKDNEMMLWEADYSKETRKMPSYPYLMDEMNSVPDLFKPLVESLFKVDDFCQSEEDEIMYMNIMEAWEVGKSKLRKWHQDNFSSFVVKGGYNTLFDRQDVVRLWDNLKDKAMKTFYVQRDLVSGFDLHTINSHLDSYKPKALEYSRDALASKGGQFHKNCRRILGDDGKMAYSNTLVGGGQVGFSGKAVVNVWDTRMKSSPVASQVLVGNGKSFGIKTGKLHKLYVRHGADIVSVHELRMLGEGPLGTLSLQDYFIEENAKNDAEIEKEERSVHNIEDMTWWDEDAVLVSDEAEEGSTSNDSDEDEDDCCYGDEYGANGSGKSVVSWCLGAVKTISSSLSK